MGSTNQGNFAGHLVQRLGEDSCLTDAATDYTISGRDLANLIAGFAAGFLAAGVNPGDRVVISCSLTPASTIAYLGAIYAGLVAVPAQEHLLSMCGDVLLAKVGAKALWKGGTSEALKIEKRNGVLEVHGNFEPRDLKFVPPIPRSEQDLAALMPTSGSTGAPQLVMVSHRNLRANTEAIIRSQQLGADEKAMLVMPISYCFGASVMQTHLYQGGGVVFDSRFMFPDKVLHAINTYGCTTFAGVPVVYNILVRRSNLKCIPLPTLRRFLQAGGALAPETIQEMCQIVPTAEFFVMYGQTEATARISCMSASRSDGKIGSAGRPLDNIEVRIVDEGGRELPEVDVGEIQVRGPSVCSGYFEDPESTERKFVNGWLKTGDLACCDDDGYLWIKGRSADFIKIRGFRVSVAEVEAKVAAVPGVHECAATAVRHPEAGEALAIFVVADRTFGEHPSEGLTERVRRNLPAHWTCSSVSLVADLPRTQNGKIARSQLLAMA